MKQLRNAISVGLILLLLMSVFCGCGKKKEYNIFTEFAAVTDGTILPRNVKYGQTLQSVLQEKSLTEAAVTGTKDRYIITDYTAEHIPYKIREKLCFVSQEHEEIKNQLYRVDYLIELTQENKEDALAAFYEQAKAALPAPDSYLHSLEDMKTGKNLIWTDKDGNTLSFSTSDSAEGTVFVSISMRGSAYQRV